MQVSENHIERYRHSGITSRQYRGVPAIIRSSDDESEPLVYKHGYRDNSVPAIICADGYNKD